MEYDDIKAMSISNSKIKSMSLDNDIISIYETSTELKSMDVENKKEQFDFTGFLESISDIYEGDEKIFNNEIYVIKKFIGAGGFKRAYLGINKRTNEEVVLFFMLKTAFLTSPEKVKKTVNNFYKEIDRLQAIIEKYNGCVSNIICPIYLSKADFIIITKYFKGIELFEFITKYTYTFENTLKIMINIISAVDEMHKKGIIHNDIKPENIMLNIDTLEICIIDMGASCDIPCESTIGTPAYLPPEISNIPGFETKKDIWAIGCLFYEILTNNQLVKNTILISIFEKSTTVNNKLAILKTHILNLFMAGFINDKELDLYISLYYIIRSILNIDYTHRPTAEDILKKLQNFKI
jgi:serine/threonine protein kinase